MSTQSSLARKIYNPIFVLEIKRNVKNRFLNNIWFPQVWTDAWDREKTLFRML